MSPQKKKIYVRIFNCSELLYKKSFIHNDGGDTFWTTQNYDTHKFLIRGAKLDLTIIFHLGGVGPFSCTLPG